MKKYGTLVVATISLLSVAHSVNAYDSPDIKSSNVIPSKDAYNVCSTLRDGESCKFKDNHITVSGICKKDQSGKGVCIPEKK